MSFTFFLLFISPLLMAQPPEYKDPDFVINSEKVSEYPVMENRSFYAGEEISFKATFGWFTVGEATLKTRKKLSVINERTCYRVDAEGKTTGLVDWLARVDDIWYAYIDTASMVSQQSVRILKEGNYKKHEITDFDHVKDSLAVKAYSFKRSKWTNWQYYNAPNDVRDMLSGYFYLRTLDFSKISEGDTIRIYGFLEDTFYDISVVHAGREKIKTKAGTFQTIKIIPVMPENSLFDGTDSVVAWISDDENKIPVKVSAKMFIGKAGVELTGYKNLRNTPNIIK